MAGTGSSGPKGRAKAAARGADKRPASGRPAAASKRPRAAATAAAPAARAPRRSRAYWLFKSEPDVYGWDHLVRDGRTFWSGVRNYQARNLLRDEIQVDDGVLFYHSNADPTAIVGIARVVAGGHPDPTQFERGHDYHDPDSDPAAPRWYAVDVVPVATLQRPLDRDELNTMAELGDMMLLRRGARLSVQPVTVAEWRAILARGGAAETW